MMYVTSREIGGGGIGAGVESLEARIVLTVLHDLAVVGLRYDSTDGHTPFMAELEWAHDRRITGDVLVPSDSGPADPTATNISDLINAPSGALRSFFLADEYETNLGARFIGDDGYPLGWLGGAMDDGSAAELSAVIERSPNATAADLQGGWTYQLVRQKAAGIDTFHSAVGQTFFNSAGGFFGAGAGSPSSGDPFYVGEGFEFDGDPDHGRFDINLGGGDTAVMYVSEDKSIILYADLDTGGSDDDAWVGFLIRAEVEPTDEEIAGEYRVGAIATRDYAEELLGGPAAGWRLTIETNGTYEIHDLADVDAGNPGSPISQGTWTKSASFVTLSDASRGLDMQAQLADNGSSLMISRLVVLDENISETMLAIATRVEADAPVDFGTSVTSGVFDIEGRPIVFDLREADDSWRAVDLRRYSFGEDVGASPADLKAFQASDGRLMAAVTTADGLFAAERRTTGFWHGLNLTESVSGAENVVSNITVFTDKGGKSYVAGLTEAGDMVIYIFDPSALSGAGAWSYLNISATHLAPRGQDTPVFVGPLMSYVTDWNGLNIAGLDADGNIRAVWTGNGGLEWNRSNLSLITGAAPMASGLTAYLTSWGGINIVGLDDDGRMVASWWVPAFGGEWRQADLTAASGGPTLTGDSLTSFVAPWGALNIAGLDASGDVVTYWWVPVNEDDGKGWEWVNLTQSIPDDEPRPTEQLQSQANGTHGGELNILGADADSGDLLRLFWRAGGTWQVQNVSDEATYV